MQGNRLCFFWAISVTIAIIILFIPGTSRGMSPNAGDTVFMAIDLTTVSLPADESSDLRNFAPLFGSRGVEPSPFILWREAATNVYRAWLMTLNSHTGGQMGLRTTVTFTGLDDPTAILWSKHFLSGPLRGVEPSPFILFRNYLFLYYLVSFDHFGTPTIQSMHSQALAIDPATYGYPTCMTELPGIAFSDGSPRLCIGTDIGYLILLINPFITGIVVDDVIRPSLEPISDLEPIPQYGYISLGVLAGRTIFGYRFLVDPVKDGRERYQQVYTLDDDRENYATDIDVFGNQDEPLPDPYSGVALVLANGTNDLALADISATQSESMTLSPEIEVHNNAIKAVTVGSLLMLLDDGSGVRYDPSYSPETGSSGCDIDVTDDENDDCAAVCGDANGDRNSNVGDAVYLINYVFKSGPAPDPECAGDANGDGSANVGDAVYLINYVFKGGPAPLDGCCP